MTSSNPEDLEEFQRLSDRYQPEVEVYTAETYVRGVDSCQGPLISQRLPIADVVAEYAQADPTFITKTRVSPALFLLEIQLICDRLWLAYTTTTAVSKVTDNADGEVREHCGLRYAFVDSLSGTVFGYFELLAKSGDVSLLEVEEIRIRSFKDIMVMAGVDYDLLMDMFDNTWELFAEIKKTIQNGADAESVVMNTLNDPVVSESIVYHFKVRKTVFVRL